MPDVFKPGSSVSVRVPNSIRTSIRRAADALWVRIGAIRVHRIPSQAEGRSSSNSARVAEPGGSVDRSP